MDQILTEAEVNLPTELAASTFESIEDSELVLA
jgi:hypothetical protein